MPHGLARGSPASVLENINCLATDHSLPRCWVVGKKKLRLMPGNVSSTITKIFKEDIHPQGVNWKAVPVDHKKRYFLKFKDHFSWAPAVGPAVLNAFFKQAAVRYRDMITRFKKGNKKPGCVPEEVWQQWLAFWSNPEVIAKSETARQNRLTKKAGLSSRHIGGSRSAYSHSIALEKKIGRAPNALECLLHIHKRSDGTFVYPRAGIVSAAVEEREREVRAAGGTVDTTQIYVGVVGVEKQRLFGSGSNVEAYVDLGPSLLPAPIDEETLRQQITQEVEQQFAQRLAEQDARLQEQLDAHRGEMELRMQTMRTQIIDMLRQGPLPPPQPDA